MEAVEESGLMDTVPGDTTEEPERDDDGQESDDGDGEASIASTEERDLPAPNEHSYLHTSHPLSTDCGKGSSKRARSSSIGEAGFVELAILELHGVVLFPGETIPVKVRNPTLVQYLGRQIDLCRRSPDIQPEVRLGILTYEPTATRQSIQRSMASRRSTSTQEQRRRGSWMRTAIRHQQQGGSSLVHNMDSSSTFEREELRHPFVGRVGTIATIQNTHESSSEAISSESLSSSQVWRRYEEGDELVLTAVGTSRFEVVAPVESNRKLFEVDEWYSQEIPKPSSEKPISLGSTVSSCNDDPVENAVSVAVDLQERAVLRLAATTPIPLHVYDRCWPWSLMTKTLRVLETQEAKMNLPSLGEIDDNILEPQKFAFWLATNLPFSIDEKLNILQMRSVIQQLKAGLEKVEEYARKPCNICCATCENQFSQVTEVFTVGGADGTTGNYVNENGFIHQITTLREVDESFLAYSGRPSTENR